MSGSTTTRGGWRPWLIWGVGNLIFAAAMFSRTSFGVAGLAAAERFDRPVALLSVFVIVQMIVYAGMQMPAGMLLDRLGSRRTLAIGTAIMATGQLGLALAPTFATGLAARVLIGGGDAMIWISVIRLIPVWFAAKHVPLLTQICSVTGQAGQWASAVPLVMILARFGWTPAFLTVAATVGIAFLLSALVIRDAPPGQPRPTSAGHPGGLLAGLREVIKMPGAQLGFFTHMATATTPLIFTFMWGFPFLTQAQGLTGGQAGGLLTVMVLAGIIIGPLMGILTRRFLAHRIEIVLIVLGATVLVWAAILLWPGRAPMWLLGLLMVMLATDFPASNIGFDFNRSYVPVHRMGAGSGMVIVGGFLAALIGIGMIGAVLTLVGGANPGPDAFRVAMATQAVLWIFATVMLLRTRRRVRAQLGPDDDPC